MPVEPPYGIAVLDHAVIAAGTTQATATRLTALTCIITSVPVGSGVEVLPASIDTQTIVNAGTNSLNVWPIPGMAILPSPVDTAISLAPGRAIGIVVANSSQAYVVFSSSTFG